METFKREIFEKLGNLFYALAADQAVSPMASGELKMLLKKDWMTESRHPSEDKVSEAAHMIGLTIDTMQSQQIPSVEAFTEFSKFYSRHPEQFSFALKQKVLETSESILKMFPTPGKNAHFEELKKLFQEMRTSSEAR